jgi:hypothetical protein
MAGDVPSKIATGKYVRQIIVSAPGPQGPAGAGSVQDEDIPGLVSYAHTQLASSTTWTVTHDLNFYPGVTVFDSGDSMVEGSISHIDATSLTIVFSSAIAGKAYLS